MKTLDDVEARIIVSGSSTPGDAANSFIIATPGSYYLTGNIAGTPGKHGISIQANDVTLDLNGFALIGGGSASRGINVPLAQSGFGVHHGSVRGWAGGGVQAAAAVTLAEQLRLSNNVGGVGLAVGNGSLVRGCVSTGNAVGFQLLDRTQISECIATLNTNAGFACTEYVSIIDCTASRNFGTGINAVGSCLVMRCTATRNLPSGFGIAAGPGCTIADCIATNNGGDGISVGAGSVVRGCTARLNESHGISVLVPATIPPHNGRCHLTGNTCDANVVGMEIRGNNTIDGNRVEGNSFNLNRANGLIITGSVGNLVIRNSAAGNGAGAPPADEQRRAYSIQDGNSAGPILDLRNGNITSISPWANFFIG